MSGRHALDVLREAAIVEILGIAVMLGGGVVWGVLLRLGVRWRVAALAFPIGFFIGGMMTRFTDVFPLWAELLMWGWMAVGNYATLLYTGYVKRPWFEEHGLRW